MQRRLITVILFALLTALVSSTVLYKVISANARSSEPSSTATILAAAKDLQPGAVVGEADIVTADWTGPVAPQWVLRREDITGRGLTAGINKGEPFPENRLAAKGAGGGLTSRIPPGMRAVSVHVDELSGLNRLIVPGMHVDILSTGASAQSGSGVTVSGMMARTILQNIEVLSTGQNTERNAKDPQADVQSVSLLVTPGQAEVLMLGVAENRIQLVLRNPLDKGHVDAPAIANLTTHPAVARIQKRKAPVDAPETAKTVEQATPASPTVEVIHGIKKVVAQVGAAGNEE